MRWLRRSLGKPWVRGVVAGGLAVSLVLVSAGLAVREHGLRVRAERQHRAEVVKLEKRLGRLEARLGVTPVRVRARGRQLVGYAALVERESLVARLAEENLRFVPSADPLPGGSLTSAYTAARLHPILRRVMPHWGVDIGARYGAPVHAMAAGRVVAVFRSPTYGLGVDVEHRPGTVTRYAHLSRVRVRRGAEVDAREEIGRVGTSGRTTGPHLHLEVYVDGRSRDPIAFLPAEVRVSRGALGG